MKVSAFHFLVILAVLGWPTIGACQEVKSTDAGAVGSRESVVESKAAAQPALDAVIEGSSSTGIPSLVFKPRGTGRTTGHIITISITNNGPRPIDLIDTGADGVDALALLDRELESVSSVFGGHGNYENGLIDLNGAMAYIPSGGKYQDYVATGVQRPPGVSKTTGDPDQFGQSPLFTIQPNESIAIPVEGYCANIRQPPVPTGAVTPDVSEWIPADEARFPVVGQFDGLGIVIQDAPGGEGPYLANIPTETGLSQDQTLAMSINPQLTPYIDTWEYNSAMAAFLFDALERIRTTAQILQEQDAIRSPFSAPESQGKELETLIQQTFWLYGSVLRGDRYTKMEFSDRMGEQFEKNTGNKVKNISSETAEKLETGVDDFWGSFELVGASAKVLTSENDSALKGSLPPGTSEKLEDALGSSDLSGVKTHSDTAGSEAADNAGATGYAEGDEIAHPGGVPPGVPADEVVHVHQPQNSPIANTADLESVGTKEEFDEWRRKKYDDYVVEREINKKSHKKACEAVGVGSADELGKALRRVYQYEKSH